ncbi:MAG: GLPGLI family protein [Bergeyella sp.]
MKKLSFLLLLISAATFGQNQRFIYEYQFKTDSTDTENPLNKEMMYLDVAKKGSKYYSRDKFVSDSIMSAEFEKQMASQRGSTHIYINYSGGKKGKVGHIIEKSYPDFKISHFSSLGSEEYKIEDSREMEWSILPEKEKIGEFDTQKATTVFAGRKWTAWFTTEIPIQDGPYKFRGLPGMIVKVEDASKTHIIEMKSSQKLNGEEWKSAAESGGVLRDKAPISIDEKKFKKLFIEHRNDPTKNLRQIMSQGDSFQIRDANGNPIDTAKMLRDREEKQKEANKKNNNLLELDLLK